MSCKCSNKTFYVQESQLYVWDDEYCDFYPCSTDHYNYCPICGLNLKYDTSPAFENVQNKKK